MPAVCLHGMQTLCSSLALPLCPSRGTPSTPAHPAHPPCAPPLQDFDTWMAWDTNPLYALLHEAIYCQGAASNWAAHRVRCPTGDWLLPAGACSQSALCARACRSSPPSLFFQLNRRSPHLRVRDCLAAGRRSLRLSLMLSLRPTAGSPSCSQVGGPAGGCAGHCRQPESCMFACLDKYRHPCLHHKYTDAHAHAALANCLCRRGGVPLDAAPMLPGCAHLYCPFCTDHRHYLACVLLCCRGGGVPLDV